MKVLITQLYQTLCNSMDCSPPGSSVHGILQPRILEWVAMSFSGESSPPRDRTWVSCIGRQILHHLSHQGSHSLVALTLKDLPANSGDRGSIPGSGRFPGEGHGYPLQYSCSENPMARGAWQTTVLWSCRVRLD